MRHAGTLRLNLAGLLKMTRHRAHRALRTALDMGKRSAAVTTRQAPAHLPNDLPRPLHVRAPHRSVDEHGTASTGDQAQLMGSSRARALSGHGKRVSRYEASRGGYGASARRGCRERCSRVCWSRAPPSRPRGAPQWLARAETRVGDAPAHRPSPSGFRPSAICRRRVSARRFSTTAIRAARDAGQREWCAALTARAEMEEVAGQTVAPRDREEALLCSKIGARCPTCASVMERPAAQAAPESVQLDWLPRRRHARAPSSPALGQAFRAFAHIVPRHHAARARLAGILR